MKVLPPSPPLSSSLRQIISDSKCRALEAATASLASPRMKHVQTRILNSLLVSAPKPCICPSAQHLVPENYAVQYLGGVERAATSLRLVALARLRFLPGFRDTGSKQSRP